MEKKMCAFPNCKNRGASRGANSVTGGKKRWKWCNKHRKGKGLAERIEYVKSLPPLPC